MGLRSWATACLAAGLLCGSAFAYASIVGTPGPAHYAHKRSPVTISGHVEDLHPGTPTLLIANARNNTGRHLVMKKLHVKIKDASATCPRTMLQTKTLRGRNALPPRTTRTVPISITLVEGAPDDCQSATFPLRFQARAHAAASTKYAAPAPADMK
jgi:hypothetical protein